MKQHIENLILSALKKLQETEELINVPTFVQVETTKDKSHGDFASNIALNLAKTLKQKPRDLASKIMQAIPPSPKILKVEIAGPGFINFFVAADAFLDIVKQILTEKENFGKSLMGRGKKVLVEFVSSNPTGPLHVGHGRHAALGAVVSNLLAAIGFKVHREYYVNDRGRQMDIVAISVWLRYLILCGETLPFPTNAYQGEYVIQIANKLRQQYGNDFLISAEKILKDLPKDEPEGGNKDTYIDALIEKIKKLLGGNYTILFDVGLKDILDDIREDLTEFGVQFDSWFSERDFIHTGVFDKLVEKLKAEGHVYELDGALWFRSTAFGDDKDRVIVRSNQEKTYFAADMAYHINKFERDFDLAIDILGSDHHGYIPRIKATLQSRQINPERLIPILVQFVTLYRHGKQVQMSTRVGEFVTLRELRKEVGNDVARFFYVMRKHEQHMDFDLDLAKSQSNENPVYYIQYAYARICSVFKQLVDRGFIFDEADGLNNLSLLTDMTEQQLLNTLSRYPEVISQAALHYETHLLTHYLRDLANDFHVYYNSQQFIVDNASLRQARLALILAVKQTLANGLQIIGVSTPKTM